MDELKKHIIQTIHLITPGMIQNSENLITIYGIYYATKGAHIKVYWYLKKLGKCSFYLNTCFKIVVNNSMITCYYVWILSV